MRKGLQFLCSLKQKKERWCRGNLHKSWIKPDYTTRSHRLLTFKCYYNRTLNAILATCDSHILYQNKKGERGCGEETIVAISPAVNETRLDYDRFLVNYVLWR